MSEAENELFTAVRLAISDPGSVLPRDRHGQYAELVTHWGARAVMEVIRERAAEVERERDELLAAVERTRAVKPLDHAMLCGLYGDRKGCYRPSCSCWCHRWPEGVVSLTDLRRALDGTEATDE
jgi:hypothetical protein